MSAVESLIIRGKLTISLKLLSAGPINLCSGNKNIFLLQCL